MLEIAQSQNAVSFSVRVIPRSSKTEIVGEHDGALKIKLTAPPVDGAANEELVRFLSKLLDAPRSNIRITAGEASRSKRIRIETSEPSAIAGILRAKI